MKSLCLLAIVKNSGKILSECLRSFLPWVENFVICDTGSTDGTWELLHEETKNYSGYLFQEDFVGFSHNRNRVIEEAEKRYPDHYFIMVDDSFVMEDGELFREMMKQAKDPMYTILVRNDDTVYPTSRIFLKGIRYKYRLHEIPDTDWKAECIPNVIWIERQVKSHKNRTKERRAYDLEQLHLDLLEHPNDSRVLYYLARTYCNDRNFDKAEYYFKKRLEIPEKDALYQSGEIFRSRMYLAMIDDVRLKPTEEILKNYLSIHQDFPEHAEPIYFASQCLSRLEHHKEAVELLEIGMKVPYHPERSLKHIVYENDIPKALCAYYFKLDTNKCIHFLYEFYCRPGMKFDLQYESYLRFLVRIRPTIPCPYHVVVYAGEDKDKMDSSLFPPNAKVFDEESCKEYEEMVSCYQIEHLVVINRVDRIAFFPNVKRVHLMILDDLPMGGSLEQFPALSTIIVRDKEHFEYLKTAYLREQCFPIVQVVEDWKRRTW